MKKKEKISLEDQEAWSNYTKQMNDIYDKDQKNKIKNSLTNNEVRTIDLHGSSLEQANIIVKNFINKAFEKNYLKIKIVTGKGNRSNVEKNPYVSADLSVLKNSIPEFIRNDKEIFSKIKKIKPARHEDGGDGAFFILLKKSKE